MSGQQARLAKISIGMDYAVCPVYDRLIVVSLRDQTARAGVFQSLVFQRSDPVSRDGIAGLLEWIVAVAGIVAVLAIGSVLVRDLRTVSAVTPVIAHEETLPDPPATVPARSVSVPVLLLSDGAELRVGDTAAELTRRLGSGAEVAPATIDRIPSGDRVTRFYAQGGQRFAVVLEPLASDGQMRIAAIYLPSSR